MGVHGLFHPSAPCFLFHFAGFVTAWYERDTALLICLVMIVVLTTTPATAPAADMLFLPQVVPEPVAKWQDVKVRNAAGESKMDLLETFYREPQRYAFPFQNYVFMTRFQQVSEVR